MFFEGVEEKSYYYPMLGLSFSDLVKNSKRSYLQNNYLEQSKVNLNIYVIGCGGTGGYLVPNLARLLSVKTITGVNTNLTLIDGDDIELKNLSRQNFIEKDLTQNKAKVLAKRYSKAFKKEIAYIDSYLTKSCLELDVSEEDKKYDTLSYTIIFSCVDNVATRFDLIDYAKHKSNICIIDCGNSEYAGQVIYSEKGMPHFRNIFPTIKYENDRPDDLSCADHALSAPQNIAANMTAAQIAFNYFNTAYNNFSIMCEGLLNRSLINDIIKALTKIDNNVTYFDIKNINYTTTMECEEILKKEGLIKEQTECIAQINDSSFLSLDTNIVNVIHENENVEEVEEDIPETENTTDNNVETGGSIFF